ncbi:phosphomannomutase/phosphoglucomutase [Acidobacteriota bacterium]
MNPGIFREYDIRGIADKDLTDDVVYRLGQAYGSVVRKEGGHTVALGRDVRPSSPRLLDRLAQGIMSAGADVVDHGIIPTPLLYFSTHTTQADGGIMITGSHNPPEYNGFKLSLGTHTLYGEEIRAFRDFVIEGDFAAGKGEKREEDITEPYIKYLSERFSLAKPLKVVVDAGNGVGAPVAPTLLRAIGAEVEELYCEPDGTFPNHHPDPTVLSNLTDLIAKVREIGADVGIAYDGDADRIGVVTEKGESIFGDRLLVLYARDVLSRGPATVICDVKCSDVLVNDVEKRGGRIILWKTGHSVIKQKMREEQAALAGEMSGHMFFADEYFGFDDSIYASCRILRILAGSDKPVSELLSDLPEVYSTPEIRIDCKESEKFEIVEELSKYFRAKYSTIDVDGVRALFDDGWGLLRASNTQPVLVFRFEARSRDSLVNIRKVFQEQIDRYGLTLPPLD